MEYELDSLELSRLNKIVTEYSKKYFLVKNQYYDQISEIQDSLINKVNICDLIDTQFTLIKELSHLVNFLFNELSFRKCIIERKDHILKDLNKVIINKFIDKLYKQEIQIAELQKERNTLQKIKNNSVSFPKSLLSESNRSATPVPNRNNASAFKCLPVNVIVPKNNLEYNGAYSFFNSSIKNIERFINIKNVNITGDNKHKSPSKGNVILKQRQMTSTSSNLSSSKGMRKSRPKSVKSRNDNFGNGFGSLTNKTNLTNISMNASNMSIMSTMTLNKTFTRNLVPSKQATTLLNKSYNLVKKYQKQQTSGRSRSGQAKSSY